MASGPNGILPWIRLSGVASLGRTGMPGGYCLLWVVRAGDGIGRERGYG